ncbi:hypothetical protein ECZU34_37630 [Escherichia coli]|nr:hypothetical protein ECZU34_37630 [Escherichia coli]
MAQREIALSLGEPPATKGYPPSAFGMIPKLVESAGNSESAGSMTAIYTVLAEGDDQQDPIVDCARAVLDGHIVLTRKLAEAGHYPAIDIGQSISRCMNRDQPGSSAICPRVKAKLRRLYGDQTADPTRRLRGRCRRQRRQSGENVPGYRAIFAPGYARTRRLELVQSRLQILFPGVKKAEQ